MLISANRRLALSAFAMLTLGIAQRAIGLIQVTILARVLNVRGLGEVTFMQSTATTFAGMSRLGTDAGLHVSLAGLTFPQDRVRAEALLGQCLTIVLCIAVSVGCWMALLAREIAAQLYRAPDLTIFVLVGAAPLIGQMLSQYCYVTYAGLHAFPRYSQITMVSAVLSAVFVITGALCKGALGAALGMAAAQAATLVLLAVGLRAELKQRGLTIVPRWPAAEALSILAIGLPFYGSLIFLIPAEFTTLAQLSRSAGVEALGELRATQALIAFAAMIPASVAGPMISHLTEGHARDGGPDPVLTQLKAIWILALALAIVMTAIWPFAIDAVFGATYVQARSWGVLSVAAFIPTMLLSVLTSALLAMRRTAFLLLVGAFHAAVLTIAARALIGRYGLGGLLVAQTLGYFAAVVFAAGALAHHFGRTFARGWMALLAAMTGGVLALLAAAIMCKEPNAARLGAATASFAVLGTVVLVGVLTLHERTAIAKIIRRGRARFGQLLRSPRILNRSK